MSLSSISFKSDLSIKVSYYIVQGIWASVHHQKQNFLKYVTFAHFLLDPKWKRQFWKKQENACFSEIMNPVLWIHIKITWTKCLSSTLSGSSFNISCLHSVYDCTDWTTGKLTRWMHHYKIWLQCRMGMKSVIPASSVILDLTLWIS